MLLNFFYIAKKTANIAAMFANIEKKTANISRAIFKFSRVLSPC